MIFSYTSLERVYKDWQKEHPEWRGDFSAWMVMQYNELATAFDHFENKQKHMDIEAVARTIKDRKKRMHKKCIFCNEVTTVINPDIEAHTAGCLFIDCHWTISRAKLYENSESGRG